MNQLAERKPSPILAMHKRYEEAAADYATAENAESQALKAKDEDGAFKANQSMMTISREQDALRIGILYQVPTSWVEAMVLQFHIMCLGDMIIGADRPDGEGEGEVLILAVETLFDFMCCEVDQDHGEIGDAFQTEANRVFFQRRRRTGIVED